MGQTTGSFRHPNKEQQCAINILIVKNKWMYYVIVPLTVVLLIGLGWYAVFHQEQVLTRTVIGDYQQAELEIVRSAARSTEYYVYHETEVKGRTDLSQIEQEIFQLFIAPIQLLENGDAWIYAPDHVVFDLSSDFPGMYRGKSMAEIFALQKEQGASHYEEISAAVMQAREGIGWYIWLPEKGKEIAAWTPVRVGDYTWTIGLSTPLPEILASTGAMTQVKILRLVIGVGTILSLSFLFAWGIVTVQRQQIERDLIAERAALGESEERLSQALDVSGAGLWTLDLKTQKVEYDPRLLKMFGYEREDLPDSLADFQNIHYPDEWHHVFAILQAYLAGETAGYVCEHRILTKNGEWKWVDSRGRIVYRDATGTPERVIGTIVDITERKRVEAALNQRIVALTQPLGNVQDISFVDLFDLNEIQAIQDTFAQATGVASVITTIEGEPITRPSNFCRLCNDIIRKTELGLKNCKYSDAVIGRANPDGPIIQPCLSGGLWNGGASISVGERHIANWLIGQVCNEELDEEKIVAYARQIGADEREFRVALQEVPMMSKGQFYKITQALYLLANQMSRIAYQNIQQARFITEHKRIEVEREKLLARVREQAQQVQLIIDTVPEGVLLLDTEEHILLANPIAQELLGIVLNMENTIPLTKLGKRPLVELLTSPPKGLWHEVSVENRQLQVMARPIEVGAMPGGWVLVIHDVTRQREIERRIQQQEQLAVVGQLAAGIAHDFNNIMATIVLYAQMAARIPNLNSRDRERMSIINQQAQHAAKLIQQILDFSRRSVLERQSLDLLPLFKEQVKLLERTLPENIQVELLVTPQEYMVYADPTRMQQMLMNLALNARDAMPAGGQLQIMLDRFVLRLEDIPPVPEMATEETLCREWIQISVSDTGTGIAEDVLPHIFEPFFTTKAPGQGSGLGLAQVHGIVGVHKGYIAVDTEVNVGTTFRIYLPALPSPAVKSFQETAEEALTTGHQETILIVEDNVVAQLALAESLEMLHYQTLAAANGREALALLAENPGKVALIISDVVMPVMGGIALLHNLREQGVQIPVILLTGHPLERELEQLHVADETSLLVDWLLKPISLEQLATVIAQALKN